MRRRRFLGLTALSAAFGGMLGSVTAAPPAALRKSHSEWKSLLSPDRYAVLFEEDTERPHTSPLNQEKREGTFVCAACFLPLFDSNRKYESGTGWPSFWEPRAGAVGTKRDFKLVWPRTEYHCARCGGHQGHVFDDGPKPTGKRYCNNGLALQFVARGEPMPGLRT
ncbi:MAG: peptide-methionine (R)-S-oxide reductase MsrB [Betaproteobacteria bacterium]|nr:peptide-methionine (R)-S-oxide reductase MsrB [Betaproteobacteria bacterium]